MGIARKRVTQQSCVQYNGLAVFTMLGTSPFTSFASLLSAPTLTTITNAESAQPSLSCSALHPIRCDPVQHPGSATIYASVMPNLEVTVDPNLTDADIVAALRAQELLPRLRYAQRLPLCNSLPAETPLRPQEREMTEADQHDSPSAQRRW